MTTTVYLVHGGGKRSGRKECAGKCGPKQKRRSPLLCDEKRVRRIRWQMAVSDMQQRGERECLRGGRIFFLPGADCQGEDPHRVGCEGVVEQGGCQTAIC